MNYIFIYIFDYSWWKTNITGYIKTNNYKNVKPTVFSSNKVSNFCTSLNSNDESLELATKEITLAFHTIIHNHSFNYMTCTDNLVRLLFYEKSLPVQKLKLVT